MGTIKQTVAVGVVISGDEAAAQIDKINTSTKSLKAQIKEATVEAMKFGDSTSKEAIEAQKKVARLKEEFSDFKDRVAAFNPEAKFASIAKLASGIAGGFAAAQGAMALFGSESEDVQKALLKVQAALALSQGLNEIKGLGDAMKNFKLVAVDAFKSLGKAIVANPLFTLVAVIGAVGTALAFLLSREEDYTAEINKQIAVNNKKFAVIEAGYDREIALAKAAGKETTELEKEKLRVTIARIEKELELEEKKRQHLIDQNVALIGQIGGDEEAFRAKFNKKKNDAELEENKKIFELKKTLEDAKLSLDVKGVEQEKKNNDDALKNYQDYLAKKKEAFQKRKDDDQQLITDLAQQDKDLMAGRLVETKKFVLEYQKELKTLPVATNATLAEADDEYIFSLKEKLELAATEITEFLNSSTGRTISFGRETVQQNLNTVSTFMDAAMATQLNAAKGNEAQQEAIRKKFFERQKKVQIAQATISMFQSATEAYKATVGIPVVGPVLAPIAAGSAIVAGIANIAKIKSTTYEGGGDAGGGAQSSAPSLNASGIEPPQLPPSQSTTTINQDGSVGNQPQPQQRTQNIRVAVLASDVEDVNNRNNMIAARSTI